jgi:hypothetical protein
MIEFEHDELQISQQRTCWKGYDGVNISRFHLEIEPSIARWIVQMNKDMHNLGVVGDHMLPWGVVGKGGCYCQLVLRLQEGRDVDQP